MSRVIQYNESKMKDKASMKKHNKRSQRNFAQKSSRAGLAGFSKKTRGEQIGRHNEHNFNTTKLSHTLADQPEHI